LTLLLCSPTAAAAVAAPKPHILMVIVDDFGWGNVGWHRKTPTPEVNTPTLDGLVKEGIELNRHYVHMTCSPSRTSFQSGRLPVHVEQSLFSPCSFGGVPRNMTAIGTKLQEAGYVTHQVGKWDAGMASPTHTPHGRGYNTSLNYYGHGNYMWTEIEWGGGKSVNPPIPTNGTIDLWDTDKPAHDLAGTGYEEYIFRARMKKILDGHNPSTPLYLNYDSRLCHYPLEAPPEYQAKFAGINQTQRQVYHAMVSFLDDQLANLTSMFKEKGMWDNTLMVLTTDNGGYTKSTGVCNKSDKTKGAVCMSGEAGANNYPLRGGKYTAWEGGIRGNAFVSGGLIPAAMRGTKSEHLMAIADWYSTFSFLAGVDPTDHTGAAAGLPPIDSLNMWPVLSGENDTSPRTELLVSKDCLVTDKWKVLTGNIAGASWPGPKYPNMTTQDTGNYIYKFNQNCGSGGCLYDMQEDMTEHNDKASVEPGVLSTMLARLATLSKGIWNRDKNDPLGTKDCQDCMTVSREKYGGFYGPHCEIGPVPTPTPGPPPAPAPGPFPPAPLSNCTYMPTTWVYPASSTKVEATTQGACCAACGMDPTCVASVLTCYTDKTKPCDCNLKNWNHAQQIRHTTNPDHTTLTCITGRKNITDDTPNRRP
jgi:arylsulfatase I/J